MDNEEFKSIDRHNSYSGRNISMDYRNRDHELEGRSSRRRENVRRDDLLRKEKETNGRRSRSPPLQSNWNSRNPRHYDDPDYDFSWRRDELRRRESEAGRRWERDLPRQNNARPPLYPQPRPQHLPQRPNLQPRYETSLNVIRRPQQAISSSFLKLPASILIRIVSYLAPVDFLRLARANTTIRKTLTHQSAAFVLRRCIESAGLPACPPGLTLGQYVALLYEPICSWCLKNQQHNDPDPYLLVRLCKGCRKIKLVDWKILKSDKVKSLVLASFSEDRQVCLSWEVKAVEDQLHRLELLDSEVVRAWVKAREAELVSRKKFGQLLADFIESPRLWRAGVKRKLRELGLSLIEEDLPSNKRGQWKGFMYRPEGAKFTEAKWNKIKQQVISFVRTEAQERLAREVKAAREKREALLRQLFDSLLDSLPPPDSRLTADDLDPRPNGDNNSVKHTEPLIDTDSIARKVTEAIAWHSRASYTDLVDARLVLKDLLNTSKSIEEVASQFENRRDEIKELVMNWSTYVKGVLANRIRDGRTEDGFAANAARPCLPAGSAKADLLEKADLDTCLLLRADSLFGLAYFFDSLGITGRQFITEYDYDSRISAIARNLLLALEIPDATSAELQSSTFTCGRCNTGHISWLALIEHYSDEEDRWELIREKIPFLNKLGIIYNYVHDIESDSSKPLARRLPASKARLLWRKHALRCKICERGRLEFQYFITISDAYDHIVDVHNVIDPDNGIVEGYRTLKVEGNPYIRSMKPSDPPVHCSFDGQGQMLPVMTQWYPPTQYYDE